MFERMVNAAFVLAVCGLMTVLCAMIGFSVWGQFTGARLPPLPPSWLMVSGLAACYPLLALISLEVVQEWWRSKW